MENYKEKLKEITEILLKQEDNYGKIKKAEFLKKLRLRFLII